MQAAYREPLLKVVNDQTGTPTFVEDLASAIILLISKNVEGVVHMTNRGQCTWYDFAVSIVYEMGLSIPVVPITTEEAGRPARRPCYSVLNQDRLSSLGVLSPSWQESLKRFMSMGMVSLTSSHR
jgi:dTDP-4-dehydrorhamnose reductase